MGISYGTNSLRIKSAHINQIVNTNGTIVSQGDSGQGFEFRWYPNNAGCGGSPNSKFYIELLDPIPWTNITYEVYTTGTASCWNFNSGGSLGTGNLVAFNSSIDRVTRCQNSFELPQYTLQMSACDNATTNFMHVSFKTGTFRSFFATRRRDSPSSLANINLELSCNGAGVDNIFIIRNIFVW